MDSFLETARLTEYASLLAAHGVTTLAALAAATDDSLVRRRLSL